MTNCWKWGYTAMSSGNPHPVNKGRKRSVLRIGLLLSNIVAPLASTDFQLRILAKKDTRRGVSDASLSEVQKLLGTLRAA